MHEVKSARKQTIDEDRYAAAFMMATLGKSRGTPVSDINPNHLTMMSAQAGHNLIFRNHLGTVSVELSIKGYKFCNKWSQLTNMHGKVIESFNPRSLERYTHPASYNSAWQADEGLSTRVTAHLSIY